METVTGLRSPLALTKDDVEAIVARYNEPGWLRQRRHAAWQAWQQLPLPNPETQLTWRRTDPKSLRLDSVAPLDGAMPARPSELTPLADDTSFAAALVLCDGQLSREFIRDDLAAKGVRVISFEQALAEIPGVLERGFMTEAVPIDTDKLTSLHGTLTRSGAVVYIPRGVEIDQPIYIGQELTTGGVAAFPHLLVYAEDMSRVTVIGETYSADIGHALVVPVVEVLARGGSQVTYIDFQRWGREVVTLPQLRAVVGRDAQATLMTLGLGSGITKGTLACKLIESGASGELLGLIFSDADQHFELDTMQEHVAGNTTSRLSFKTALAGASTVISNGMVRIEPNAQKSDAYQENRNLLLSKQAHADPIPALEILANDVRCSHGTTVGPIDDDQAFYIQCRGLHRDDAERLIVHGFFREVLDRLPSAIEARLDEEIERKIERTPL